MKVTGEVKIKGQIFSFTRISSLFFVISVIGAFFLGSCTKVNEFTIGQDFLESQTKLQIVDTFKVDISTILVDSLATSSTKVGLVGNYSDDVFGSVKSNCYFDLAFQSVDNIEENAIYDSAAFIFSLNRKSYGDTTKLMSVGLHQLTEVIVPFSTTNYLYNTSSFDFSPLPLATTEFIPGPNSNDTTLTFHINSFGENFFSLLKTKDASIIDQTSFTDLFKGFVLTSEGENNDVVLGLTADNSHFLLKLYYHVDNIIPEKKEIKFTMGEASHQFNNIIFDFSNSVLKDLKTEHKGLKSTETGNKVYIQGLTGILAKFQFPTVQDLLMQQRWKILKADLVFEPVRNSFDVFPLPQRLNIYDTDSENRINSLLKDRDGNPILPTFVYDEFFHVDTRYTFDITSFINQELSDRYFDYQHGLLVGLDQNQFLSTLSRLSIEGANPPVKLRLYYLTY